LARALSARVCIWAKGRETVAQGEGAVAAMSGEVVVVTGGGRGFGRAMAERFAAEGASVAVLARSKHQLGEVVSAIEASGGRAMAAACDVTSAQDIARVCSEVRDTFGAITRLVSNAGVPGPFGPLWVTDPDRWWSAQEVHIRAPYLLLQAVLPDMVASGNGRVICISAIAAQMTLGMLSAYSVGKAALNKLVEMAAEELKGTGVTVFALEPGFVVTQLAVDTENDPDAQKYLGHMMQYLDEGRARPDADADLHRCAQRAVDLFSGRYDALSGGFITQDDPIDQWAAEAGALRG
jgi:NAD(P)-dependent dehydrogenase (short-subunit alcohol dehydrogenase family)